VLLKKENIMTNNNPKLSRRFVMSSTHIDKHRTKMTKEALESGLKFINGNRKPRLGLEHNQTLPPLGRINNGEVVQGDDGEYYLVADQEFFDVQESITLSNGLELIMESFSDNNFPFVECEFEERNKIEIKYDFVNFESYQKGKEFINELQKNSDVEFEGSIFSRKSVIPDPEIIVRITEILGIALGIGLRKIPEKLGDAIGEDLAKLYKLLSNTIKKSVLELLPKNQPIHFIVEIPIDKSFVELIVTTRNPDIAINAYDRKAISKLRSDMDALIKTFNVEKIQYFLNDKNIWELNYMLTEEGKVIGTKKSFKRRNDFFQEMIEKQDEIDKENKA
jgi:hypothetical protein